MNVFIIRIGKFGIFSNEHIHKNTFKKNVFMNIFIEELVNLSNLVNWLWQTNSEILLGAGSGGGVWVSIAHQPAGIGQISILPRILPRKTGRTRNPNSCTTLLSLPPAKPTDLIWKVQLQPHLPSFRRKRPPEHSRTAVMLQHGNDYLARRFCHRKHILLCLAWY